MRTLQARPLAGPSVAAAALVVATVCVLPLLVIGAQATGQGWGATRAQLLRPRVAELLGNTLALVGVTVTACVVLGVTAAWLVERTTLPGASVWRVLLVAPLAVPAFVNAYAWVSLRPGMDGLGAAALVTTLSYLPFVFVPCSAALRGLDQSWEDTARSLGLGRWRTFWRVVLPQLRPALLGGALLVALHLLAEFGVLAMLRYPTFTTAILEQYEAAFDLSAGGVLALVLMGLCATFLEYLLRGRRRHTRLGSGVVRRPEPVPLGRWLPVVLAGLTGLVLLALGVPLASLTRWLGSGGAPLLPPELIRSLASTGALAVAAGAVTVVAAFPLAVLLERRRGVLATALERVTYVSSALPGVVIALALVTLAIRWLGPLYQSSVLLVVAYVILFVPRATVSIRAAFGAAPPSLVEAARALGSSPLRALRRVVLPLVLPGVLGGFALVFIATSTELTATLLLAPTGTTTLATAFWSASDALDYALAAPYALAMIVLSAPLTWFVLRRPEEVNT